MNGPAKTNFISLEEFKSRARDGNAAGLALRKQYISEVKVPDDEEELVLQFAISTGVEDRDRDTINSKGWQLKNYKKNPVVLWAHSYWSPPVAKARKVWVEDDKLKAIAEFANEDLYPFAYMIYRMCKEGYLNATSVGFRPLKWEERRTDEDWLGYSFLKQELLEFSIVPVPSNPEALIEAKSAGIDTAPMVDWAKQILDGEHGEAGIWVPRKQLEGIVGLLEPNKAISIPEKGVEDPDKPVEIEETAEEPVEEPEEIKETEPTETTEPADDAVDEEVEEVVEEALESSGEDGETDEESDKTKEPPADEETTEPDEEIVEGDDIPVDPIEQLRAEIAELKGLVMGLVKETEATEESTGDEPETIEESTENEEVLFELADGLEISNDEVEDEGDDDVIDLAAIDDLGEVIEAAVRDALNQARGRLD